MMGVPYDSYAFATGIEKVKLPCCSSVSFTCRLERNVSGVLLLFVLLAPLVIPNSVLPALQLGAMNLGPMPALLVDWACAFSVLLAHRLPLLLTNVPSVQMDTLSSMITVPRAMIPSMAFPIVQSVLSVILIILSYCAQNAMKVTFSVQTSVLHAAALLGITVRFVLRLHIVQMLLSNALAVRKAIS